MPGAADLAIRILPAAATVNRNEVETQTSLPVKPENGP